MAFTKTTWVDGSSPAITATQLNRIEQGIDDAHAGNIDAGAIGTTELANDSVTNAKLRNSAALSVIGRASNSTGDPADISAGSDGYVLRRDGTSLGFGQVETAGIANSAVTPAKTSFLDNIASSGKVYFGIVDSSTGTSTLLPTGWSLSQYAAAGFAISHNLGTTDYFVLAMSHEFDSIVHSITKDANQMLMETSKLDLSGDAPGEVHFMVVVY